MTLEDILAAADETLQLALVRGMDRERDGTDRVSYPHLVSMRERMNAPGFSIGKANRWLGWMQAAVYAHAITQMVPPAEDTFEQINKAHRSDT